MGMLLLETDYELGNINMQEICYFKALEVLHSSKVVYRMSGFKVEFLKKIRVISLVVCMAKNFVAFLQA